MKTEFSVFKSHLYINVKDLETRGIWEDAGFRPPQFYMQLIEFLHITLLKEGYIPECYMKEIIGIINSPCNDGQFVVNDRKRMYGFAESIGIDVLKGDENVIATLITRSIISDYVVPDGISFARKKIIFSNK